MTLISTSTRRLYFTDGTSFWNQLSKEHKLHKKGFFILGPSGIGKTHFVKNQSEPHWIDGDSIWTGTNAAPAGEWWLRSGEDIGTIDARSDVMTAQAKTLGFWVIGASNYWLKPDAIVIPHWSTHQNIYATARNTHMMVEQNQMHLPKYSGTVDGLCDMPNRVSLSLAP